MDPSLYSPVFRNPFTRPSMTSTGAASSSPPPKGKWLKGIVAGGITGGIEICITYPVEYVKTQLQLDRGKGEYKGSLDVVQKTFKSHGILGFYRGLGILVLGSVPKVAVRFGSFEIFKSLYEKNIGEMGATGRMLCGLGAGVSEAILVVTPLETVKTKMINDQKAMHRQYHGLFHGIGVITKKEGLSGLYQGVVPTILKQGSNQAIRFYCMETFKEMYRGKDKTKHIPKYIIGCFGAISGGLSVLANSPLDVVKTRMQGLQAKRYKGTLDCFSKIYQEEGLLAFYKGVAPRLVKVCLDVSITFMVYDSFMDFFNKIWP